jgi:hypothetical protein
MSNTQIAFLSRSNIPNREALQASINRLGFNLTLHPEFTPIEDSGFSPCILDGTPDVGFEVFYAPTLEVAESDSNLKAIAVGRDFSISMIWRGSMKDYACVMIVSCALAKDFGAVVTYEGEPPESFETLLESTMSIVADAANEKPWEPAPTAAHPPKKRWWRLW